MACANTKSKNLDDHDNIKRVAAEKFGHIWFVYWKCYSCGFDWIERTDKDPRNN